MESDSKFPAMAPKHLCSLILAATLHQASASLLISDLSTHTVDFSGFVGDGFAPTPGAGQLDSDTWRATGLSDGNGTFGGTHTTGDFARGTDPDSPHDGVGSGGVYGFEVSSGNHALGVQPTGSDFSPGTFTLRLQNDTGQTIDGFELNYDILAYNNENRSSSFNFSWSADDASYTAVPALDFVSPAAEGAPGTEAWATAARSATLSGLSIADGSFFYLQWLGDDAGGSGSRDEIALDNIAITASAIPEVSTTLPLGILLGFSLLRTRRRRK